jgi:uncharacterized protein (DUF2141 family)
MSRSRSLLACVSLTLLAGQAAAEEGAAPSVLEFRALVRSSRGVVRCGLFSEAGWLKTPVQARVAAIRGGAAVCVFNPVAPGVYGISAFHDQNGNGQLDTNFLGLPSEDYCASRDARNPFGPPSFANAKFSYTGGLKRLSARMH